MKYITKQVLILGVFAFIISAAAIVHGLYFDMEPDEIKRLTVEGLLLTFIVLYPTVLIMEWIFDFDNKKKIKELEERVSKLEEGNM